jgi:hypothetical protein
VTVEGKPMPEDTDTTSLERRYRRWLFAYPRAYRQGRGAEILATLLDAAEPGRSRPPAREVVYLIRHGLSVRAAEVGRRAVVVAVVAAVLGGLSGIALGSWLSWRDVDPMTPDRTTAMSLARTVLPGPVQGKVEYYGRHTFWNPNSKGSLRGGTGLRAGRATVTGAVPPQGTYRELAAAVQQRMRAQGWQDVRSTVERYGAQVSPSARAEVTGTRDGYLATVQTFGPDQANPASLSVDIMRAEPPGHLRDTVLGGLAGVVFGALLGLLTAHRMSRHSPRRQRAYSRLCLATLLMLTPACLGNIPTATGSLLSSTHRNGTGPSIYWGGFVFFGAQPLAILSLIPIAAIIVGCLWPRTENARTRRIA